MKEMLALVVVSVSALAAERSTYSEEQLAERIDELNEVCGDTYCEGNFNYNFKKLTCSDEKHCVVSFTARNRETKSAKPVWVELEIANFRSSSMSGTEEDKNYVYEGSVEDAVGQALMKWEKNPVAKRVAVAPRPKLEEPLSSAELKVVNANAVRALNPVGKAGIIVPGTSRRPVYRISKNLEH